MRCGGSGVGQRLRDAQAAEDLHRTRGDVVALDVGRFAALADLGHQHVHAALRQVHGEREADGACPDDENLRLQGAGHANSRRQRKTSIRDKVRALRQ